MDFCGTPAQGDVRGKNQEGPVFLNFEAQIPLLHLHCGDLGYCCRCGIISELPERYSGKTLLIHGVVSEHNGKPEIILAARRISRCKEE